MFSCIYYAHVPFKKRSKLDDKSEKGIFLGYSTQSKGYRVYNLRTKKLMISRDVEFDESATWNWDEEKIERRSIITSTPAQQSEATETTAAPTPETIPPASPRQEDSSPESTPRRTRPLAEIYESCNFAILEPESYEAAAKQEVWVKAMEEEMKMIEKNKTWELVDRPKDKDVIGVKWVYKTKLQPDGSIQKHKARLVVKGYS